MSHILRWPMPLLLLLLPPLLLFSACEALSLESNSGVTFYRGINFSHIELYTSSSGVEYIVLAQPDQVINLRADFTNAQVTVIGPRNDSANCLPHQVMQRLSKCNIRPMPNNVKAMFVRNGYLYFCMTYLCGSCHKTALVPDQPLLVDFNEIDEKLRHATRAVLCRDPAAKTTLTVAPKYLDPHNPPEDGLYLAMPFCIAKHLNLESSVESIMSVVSLATLQPFKIGDFSPFWSEVIPSGNKRRPDVLSYHYSFTYSSGNYSYVYYLLTAKNVLRSDFSEMRIGRFCTKDLFLSGYVEMFITCNVPDASPAVRCGYFGETATFVQPGSQLAKTLGAEPGEPVLFYTARVLDQEVRMRQGVCAIPIWQLNKRLDDIITDCGRGLGYHGPNYIRQQIPCTQGGLGSGGSSASSSSSSASGAESSASSGGPPYCTVASGLQTEWTGTADRMGSSHTYHGVFLAEVDPTREHLTAIAVTPVYNGRTALFLGTSKGSLLRYSIGSGFNSTLYSRTDVTGGRQQEVLALRTGSNRLFALTQSKVSSHPYADCESRYKTCQACLESQDPHCVWSNRDTVGCLTWLGRAQPDRDFITSAAECLQVTSVGNSAINVDANVTDALVSLVVTKAPDVSIFCYYMNSENDRAVFKTRRAELERYHSGGFGISCRVSVPELRLYLGDNVSRNLTVRLSTAATDAEHYLVSVIVQAYNCRRHSNCTVCVGSSTPCRWLPKRSACVAATNAAEESVVVSDVSACPAVRPLRRLVLPSGFSEDLTFSVTGFYREFMHRFDCQLSCSGDPSTRVLPARMLTNSSDSTADSRPQLHCLLSRQPLSYPTPEPSRTCRLKILWHSGFNNEAGSFDSLDGGGSLLLYKCHRMASQCDDCTLYTDELYRCVWCVSGGGGGGGVCSDSCTPPSPMSPAAVVPRHGVCPMPRIDLVKPAKLTKFVEGLQLAVTGVNLGNSAAGVSVQLVPDNGADAAEPAMPCDLLPGSYRPGKALQCGLRLPPATAEPRRVLSFGSAYKLQLQLSGLASEFGADADVALSAPLPVGRPSVDGVSAAKVQQNGRPVLSLFGSDLDAGSSLQVVMQSDQFMFSTAEVLSRSASNASVQLGVFYNTGIYFVSTTVQNCTDSRSDYRKIQVQALPDARPDIHQTSVRRGLIPSGGLPFDINAGHGLEAVVSAQMRFVDLAGGGVYLSDCNRRNLSGIVTWSCPSPTLPEPLAPPPPPSSSWQTARPPAMESRVVDEEAEADNTARVRRSASTATYGSNFNITYGLDARWFNYPNSVSLAPDPELLPVPQHVALATDPDSRQQLGSREFKIRGRHLIPTLLPGDVTVRLGSWPCPTQALLQETQLQVITCRLPDDPSFFKRAHPVTVLIGRRLYHLGSVTVGQPDSSLAYILGAVAVVIIASIIIGIFFCVRYYVRSKDQDKSKNLEHRMNLLEAKMSQTCRDAFAELQLNSNGADGVNGVGIDGGGMPAPCRSFEEFACFTCFPERYEKRFEKNDQIFADVVRSRNSAEDLTESQGLEELDRLLHNRLFLFTLIDTLEMNSEIFRHHERSQFGSLLSALLLDDMECFTELLTGLIVQLITRKHERQDNYKVVFRRCDSVAERLLPNWLAFLMYEQLADNVVEPFYRLYLRIKYEVYKGPVDQCTEDSKYTINEQKLLRKDVEFRTLKLIFQDRLEALQPLGSDGEPWTIRVSVLDCDSVYQAKVKLLDAAYTALRVRFSQRLPPETFELVQITPSPTQVATDADAQDHAMREQKNMGSDVHHICLNTFSSFNDSITVYLRQRPTAAESNGTMYRSVTSRLVANTENATLLLKSHSSKSLIDGSLASRAAAGTGAYATVQHQQQPGGSKSKAIPPKHFHLALPCNGSQTMDRAGKKKTKQQTERSQGGHQTVPEAYLPILLSTKKNLAGNITDLFSALFPAQESVPLCIKYIFDQLDDIARDTGLSRDAAHIWKSNALTLRFYMQLLMNAQHLMDVEIRGPVRYCLSTVATVFMDACSVDKPAQPDRSAPSQRLLFVNEIADFHPRVESYYSAVRSGIREPTTDMLRKFQAQVNSRHCAPFCRSALLRELFNEFVYKFHHEILKSLSVYGGPSHGDQQAVQLSKSLMSIINLLSSHHTAATLPVSHLRQQQQPAPLTYQQMQLVPPYQQPQSATVAASPSPYAFPSVSTVSSSNRSTMRTFGGYSTYS